MLWLYRPAFLYGSATSSSYTSARVPSHTKTHTHAHKLLCFDSTTYVCGRKWTNNVCRVNGCGLKIRGTIRDAWVVSNETFSIWLETHRKTHSHNTHGLTTYQPREDGDESLLSNKLELYEETPHSCQSFNYQFIFKEPILVIGSP